MGDPILVTVSDDSLKTVIIDYLISCTISYRYRLIYILAYLASSSETTYANLLFGRAFSLSDTCFEYFLSWWLDKISVLFVFYVERILIL